MSTRSRTKTVAINSFFGIVAYIATMILTFVLQRFFVKYLGYELQGLNNFFVNIINTLSVAEVGIGVAIIFSLFKPISEGNQKKVAAVISLFRKMYLIIGLIVAVLSVAIIPLLPTLSKDSYELSYLLPPYIMFVANTLLTYVFTFNHTIIVADFKNYIQSIVSAITKIVMILLQVMVIVLTKDFYIFVAVMLIVNTVANICFSVYVSKKYPYLKTYRKAKVDSQEKASIKTNIFALVFHRVGNYIVQGADSIIISAFIGLTLLGYYSNYLTIIVAFTSLLGAIFSGMSSGFGNLIATSSQQHVRGVFYKAHFANYFLVIIMTVGFFVMSPQFMLLWLTAETILPLSVIGVVSINFYIITYSRMLGDVRAAAGIFRPDRNLHIIMAIVKLIISLLLVNVLGIVGVLIGTTVCYILKEVIVLPVICSKHVYGGRARDYYLKFIKDTLILCVAVTICYFINNVLKNLTNYEIINFALGAIICVILVVTCVICANFKTEEFKHIIRLIKGLKDKLKVKKVSLNSNKKDV